MELYYRRKIEAEKKETFDAKKRSTINFEVSKSAMRRTG